MNTMTQQVLAVTVGVDTHADTHVAAAVDAVGVILGTASFPATAGGYAALLGWAQRFGPVQRFGVEGTGSYGAGLARHLRAVGQQVVEVDRPDRKTRRLQGKSDPIDAEAAARAALSGKACGRPKTRDGDVEMIRILRVARGSAVKSRTMAANQIAALVTTAPEALRAQLRGLTGRRRVDRCAALRPGPMNDPTAACKFTLRQLARRCHALDTEVGDLNDQLAALVTAAAPALIASHGIGVETAGQRLITAGDNTDRLHSEASFAHLCGVAPLPASSGRTTRHRLNRGGDRAANHALWRIAMVRLAHDPRTRAYAAKRTKDGLSKKETMRCLKRAIAREVYRLLPQRPRLDKS